MNHHVKTFNPFFPLDFYSVLSLSLLQLLLLVFALFSSDLYFRLGLFHFMSGAAALTFPGFSIIGCNTSNPGFEAYCKCLLNSGLMCSMSVLIVDPSLSLLSDSLWTSSMSAWFRLRLEIQCNVSVSFHSANFISIRKSWRTRLSADEINSNLFCLLAHILHLKCSSRSQDINPHISCWSSWL